MTPPPTFELFRRPTPPLQRVRESGCPPGHVLASAFDVLRPLGLTYRQLDYWTRIGILVCDPDSDRGSGFPRYWHESEIGVAAAMLRLLDAGCSHNVARAVARKGPAATDLNAVHELGTGLILVATPALWRVPEPDGQD